MFAKVALLCLVSLAVAQYQPHYDAPDYSKPYDVHYDEKPQPYSFGYDVKDEYGSTLNRREEGDELGNKKGSYGYTDGYGIYRQVDYVADEHGFRATVKTNEPGTDNQDPADVQIHSEAAPAKYDAPVYAHAAPVYKADAPVYSHAAPVYGASAAYPAAPVYAHQPAYASPAVPVYAHEAPKYSAPAPSVPVYSAPAHSAPVYGPEPPQYHAPVYSAPEHTYSGPLHSEPEPSYSAPIYSVPETAPDYSAPLHYDAPPTYDGPSDNYGLY